MQKKIKFAHLWYTPLEPLENCSKPPYVVVRREMPEHFRPEQEDHAIKIHFNLQFKYMNFMFTS